MRTIIWFVRRHILPCIYGSFLGGAIPILFGAGMSDWRWWFIITITALLVVAFHSPDYKEPMP